MRETDTPLFELRDVAAAFGLLTRLPLRIPDTVFERGAAAGWAYPLVGLALAALAGITGQIGLWFGLAPFGAALLALVTLLMTTGALHEDGLADTADGLWGGWTRERRLEIMKDSHIGSYGVIGLIVILAGQIWAMIHLWDAGGAFWSMAAAACMSRAAMPSLMHFLPHARDAGLSHAQGTAPGGTALAAGAIGAVLGVICVGWGALWLLFFTAALTAVIGILAEHKIGGQTGDILGATQKVTELAILLILASQ